MKNVDFGSNSDEEDDWDPEDVEEEFSCIECEFNSPLQVKLKEHIDRQHTKSKKTTSKRKATVKIAPQSKKNKDDKDKISCEICCLNFSRKDSLKRHMYRKH